MPNPPKKGSKLSRMTPEFIKNIAKKFVDMEAYYHAQWSKNNPFVGTPTEWEFKGVSDFTLGILYDPAHYHRYYMGACQDFGISYKVLKLESDNWVELIESSNCAAFLVWPHINTMVLKEMFDERLSLMRHSMNKLVYPEPEGIFLLDNKRRVRDWAMANGFEIPKTWCFFNKEEALSFARTADFPLIYKTIKGSVSRGVKIVASQKEAESLISQCFSEGVYPYRMDPRNRQWNFILFQEYLPECDEKRLVRIGDDYIAIDKVRGTTAFHSGSGYMQWANPDRWYLDQTRLITEKAGWRCMNVDFLVDNKGKAYVNELHAVFHGPQIPDSEWKGIWRYNKETDQWTFVPGNYYRNYATNLRVMDVVNLIGKAIPDEESWLKKPTFRIV